MTGIVKRPAKPANRRTGHLAGKSRPNGRSISAAMREFKRLFPTQTAVELVLRTGADIRHCERCLTGRRDLGGKFQQKLLQSDVGREILIALMGDAAPAWWRGYRRHLKISELRRAQADHQRRIEALESEAAE